MKQQHRTIILLLFSLLLSKVSAACEKQDENVRKAWIGRSRTELEKLEEKDKVSSAYILSVALIEIGEIELAKTMSREFLPARQQHVVLMFIAIEMAEDGQLEAAYETIEALSEEDFRQTALSLVASRLARAGKIKSAKSVLEKITQPRGRDRAIKAIAKAYQSTGELDLARTWARRIDDPAVRSRALDEINKEFHEIPPIRPPWLRDQLVALLEFSRPAGVDEALAAIEAAQSGDTELLNKHQNAALAEAENSTALDQATIMTLLALAIAESDKDKIARDMIVSAKAANDEEWLGISSLFGNPVLIYLLLRLDLHDELQEMLVTLKKSESIGAEVAYLAAIQAIGSSYSSLNRMGEAEKHFDRLESPLERVHFSAGVLLGLEDDPSP